MKINTQLRAKDMLLLALVLGLLVVFELSPFGGNVRFYSKWISCGQKPVRSAFVVGGSTQYYENSPSFYPLRTYQPEYFCTPLEAEKAGYSANSDRYEFPNLNQKN